MSVIQTLVSNLLITFVIFLPIIKNSNASESNGAEESRKLLQNLTKYFTDLSPPLDITNNTARLYIDIEQIVSVNEKQGSIAMRIVTIVFYHSNHAIWNPEDYNGVEALAVPRKTFWHPPICK